MTTVSTVVVEQIASRQRKTKYGIKTVYSFKAAGQWFNTNFKNHGLTVGDIVSFDYTEDQYGKQVDVAALTKQAAVAPTAPAAPPPVGKAVHAAPMATTGAKAMGKFPIDPLDGQRSIIRQNSLTNAREVVVAYINGAGADWKKVDDSIVADRIIALARKFEAYSAGDLDLEEVKKEMADAKKAA